MRATLGTTYRTLQNELAQMNERLDNLRVVAATGKRINKPSDDPTAIRPILFARSDISESDRYMKTIRAGQDRLANAEGHLEHMDNLLVRAKEIAIAGMNGALNSSDRATYAQEVGQLQAELLDVANAQLDGKYQFAGFQSYTVPFASNPAYDPVLDPRPYLYQGDNGSFELEIGPDETIPVNVPGSALLLGDTNGDGLTDPGGVDIFAALSSLKTALEANDPTLVEPHLTTLDEASEQIRAYRSSMGNTAGRLDAAYAHMEDINIEMQAVLSRYEDADLIGTLTDLSQQESALEAALSVTGKLSRISILNYL